VELAGGNPHTQYDLGSFSAEAIETAADKLENLSKASLFLPGKGLIYFEGTAQVRGNGQAIYFLGPSSSFEDAKAYLQLKAKKLRKVAAEARAADSLVSYG
jgi:hypothetical protein